MEEITKLKKIERAYDSFLVTEKSDFEVKDFCRKTYFVPQINRKELFFLPKFMGLFVTASRILKQEQPDIVITTGALACYPFCIVAKRRKKKVIYIESFARVHEASLTGKLLYGKVDLFIVQWPEMLKTYPKAVLGGGIF